MQKLPLYWQGKMIYVRVKAENVCNNARVMPRTSLVHVFEHHVVVVLVCLYLVVLEAGSARQLPEKGLGVGGLL
jgi:hypothetical protein